MYILIVQTRIFHIPIGIFILFSVFFSFRTIETMHQAARRGDVSEGRRLLATGHKANEIDNLQRSV